MRRQKSYTAESLEAMGLRVSRYAGGTWAQVEEAAYGRRGATLSRLAAVYFEGRLRRAYLGVPDTFYTVPARCNKLRGFVTVDDSGALVFHAVRRCDA